MKLVPSLLVLAIAGGVAPAAVAGQKTVSDLSPQEKPIVLAQANAASAAPQPDFILNDCQGTASDETFAGTALRGIDPGYALVNALNIAAGKPVVTDLSAIKNITLLEGTKHGKLVEQRDNEGLISYYYDPIPDYVGNDRAVFMADFEGKHYKIIINLKVSRGLDNDLCPIPPGQLIKVNKPTSGFYGNGFALDTVPVTFAPISITVAEK